MFEVTKDTVIGEILSIAPDAAPIFMAAGMHCLYCPASQGETLEEACFVHGLDVETMLDELNAHLALKAD